MRSHYCGQINESHIGQTVTLCGWADVSRNLGGVCFIDLRDHEGIVQVVAEPDNPAYVDAEKVGYEYCLRVTGSVRARHSTGAGGVGKSATGIVQKKAGEWTFGGAGHDQAKSQQKQGYHAGAGDPSQ